jgi:hypothetical protein
MTFALFCAGIVSFSLNGLAPHPIRQSPNLIKAPAEFRPAASQASFEKAPNPIPFLSVFIFRKLNQPSDELQLPPTHNQLLSRPESRALGGS